MMQSYEIEAWALQVIQAVRNKQPNEDSRVELKREWPSDYPKTARQIAGHCNALRGEHVLWLVGIDETEGIKGAEYAELTNWFAQIDKWFDPPAPRRTELNIPTSNGTVVAILFTTERVPYVVKNPLGGQIGMEVPWRENTRTRSACRADLLQILTPLQALPEIDVLTAQFQPAQMRALTGTGWKLNMNIYVIPRSTTQVVIPLHRCHGYSEFIGMGQRVNFENISFNNNTIQQLICKEPTNLVINASHNGFPCPAQANDKVNIELSLFPVGAAQPFILSLPLYPEESQVVWRLPNT